MSTRHKGAPCLVAFLLVATLLGPPVLAQSPDATISMSVDSITETDAGFVVTGSVTTEGPISEAHVNRYYTAHVLAEIKNTDSAQYPELPEALRMTTPEGAETAYVPGSGPSGTMTYEELYGVDITTIELASSGGPSTFEFTGTIPAQHSGKRFRIRAWLDYQVMYSGAMYPGISYKHTEGLAGVVSGSSAPTSTPGSDASASDVAGGAEDLKDSEPAYDVSGDLDIDTPAGDIMDDLLGHGGDFYTKPLTGTGDGEPFAFTPPSTPEGLEELIKSYNAQLARDDLSHEQRADITDNRNKLVPLYHQALLDAAALAQLEVWSDFHKTMDKAAADKLLTYSPSIGPVWSFGKMKIAEAEQRWGDMFLNASTVPPSIPVGGDKWIGNPSQLIQDYLFIANEVMPTGTYGNWKAGAAGPQSPTWGGEKP